MKSTCRKKANIYYLFVCKYRVNKGDHLKCEEKKHLLRTIILNAMHAKLMNARYNVNC